jgi:hypothetical protein
VSEGDDQGGGGARRCIGQKRAIDRAVLVCPGETMGIEEDEDYKTIWDLFGHMAPCGRV